MRYIKEKQVHQIEINKSIFICVIIPIDDILEVKHHIDILKTEYPKANHYCHAAMCGESAEHMIASDDGEPQRTAGIPILEVLKHHELTNTLAVVIRYFGGIKLGAGGLVRAYTKSIAETLKLSRFYHKKIVQCYELSLPYSLVDTFEYQYKDKIEIIDKTYVEHVSLKILLLESDLSLFDEIKHLIINIKPLEPETLYVLDA
ncbi:MAG: YigZ family protein [Acholeplasmataceae bacterium]|jgi:uncharacterized YigZ family protein|nr:YigZ family protein [Acholeplasmataceae bacterium]